MVQKNNFARTGHINLFIWVISPLHTLKFKLIRIRRYDRGPLLIYEFIITLSFRLSTKIKQKKIYYLTSVLNEIWTPSFITFVSGHLGDSIVVLGDFRPMSNFGSLYNLIAKVLANRLMGVMCK